MYHNLQITKVMDGEEDKVDKGESGPLETNNQETMPVKPRIRIRSDLFKENRNANVVQNMMLMHQLESRTETDSEGEDEVEIVNVVEGNVSEELEMKEVLEKTVFGGLLPKAARKLKPARKGLSVRLIIKLGKHACNMILDCVIKMFTRTGRGGRNELKQQQGVRDIAVLNHMLGNTVRISIVLSFDKCETVHCLQYCKLVKVLHILQYR